MDMVGKGLGFWKTMPMRRRTSTGSEPLPYTSISPTLTEPSARASGMVSCIRFKQRTKVLLPQPEGPMTAVTWLAATVMSMEFSDRFLPYQAFSPRTSIPTPIRALRSLHHSTAGGDADCRHRAHDQDDQDQRSGPRLFVDQKSVV